jgi:surfeit locus 1 family protein
MRRSPALVAIAAVALIALTARLGWWQLDRAAQKLAVESAMQARHDLPTLDASALARTADQATQQYHRAVRLVGRWDGAHTLYLENRTHHGQAGFIVLTPFVLTDGSAVAVQRGWLPRDRVDRTRVQAPSLPDGPQALDGRIAAPPSRLYDFDGAVSGAIRQNVDLSAWAQETGLALRPLSVLQTASPVADGLQRDWPQPAADVHKHYGYAFQWFALSALTLILYVWFQIIRPRRRRARPD